MADFPALSKVFPPVEGNTSCCSIVLSSNFQRAFKILFKIVFSADCEKSSKESSSVDKTGASTLSVSSNIFGSSELAACPLISLNKTLICFTPSVIRKRKDSPKTSDNSSSFRFSLFCNSFRIAEAS